MRSPYFRAQSKALSAYFQDTLGKKGSPTHVSIAQNAMGRRIQLSPAPAICAKSSSVWFVRNEKKRFLRRKQRETYDESIVMILELVDATAFRVCGHGDGECPFIYGSGILLIIRWRDKRLHDQPSSQIDAEKEDNQIKLEHIYPIGDLFSP